MTTFSAPPRARDASGTTGSAAGRPSPWAAALRSCASGTSAVAGNGLLVALSKALLKPYGAASEAAPGSTEQAERPYRLSGAARARREGVPSRERDGAWRGGGARRAAEREARASARAGARGGRRGGAQESRGDQAWILRARRRTVSGGGELDDQVSSFEILL